MDLLQASDILCEAITPITFRSPVTHVYNPLLYARTNYANYVSRYGQGPKRAIFLGMNPGPWGMAQTGVPFGDVGFVRDWLQLDHPVDHPLLEHPQRPVLGMACHRREASGSRLWGAARDYFQTPSRFFRHLFVANYCPLCFLEASGRNRTPDKLLLEERQVLFAACDEHLRHTVAALSPRYVVGIGNFAAARAREALAGTDVQITQILHPSPANPAANQGWAEKVKKQLSGLALCPAQDCD